MCLLTCIILSLHSFCVAKEAVPTLLLDYDHVMGESFLEQNPFARMTSPQFTDIVQEAIKQYAVVILFVEDTFSTEDISIKDQRGSPYTNLREEMLRNKVKYIPNVENPLKVVTKHLPPIDKNMFVLKPGQLFHSTEFMSYFYVFFSDDNNATRTEVLRRHDLVIQHVYETIRKMTNGAVLGIYTGKVNPVSVGLYERGAMVRHDPYSPIEKGIVLASPSVLYRFVGLTIDSGERTRRSFFENGDENEEMLSEPEEKKSDESVQSKVRVGEYELEFFFMMQPTRWRLDRIKLYEANECVGDHNLSTYIGAPHGMSYLCDEPLVFYNTRDDSAMVIPEYQIQPFVTKDAPKEVAPQQMPEKKPIADEQEDVVPSLPNGDVDELPPPGPSPSDVDTQLRTAFRSFPEEFGPPVKCTPYFTIGILTGLVVSFLCLTILLSGVFCLYHCETNDLFDDPQAKQMTVLAGN